jgi:hypothetical protein
VTEHHYNTELWNSLIYAGVNIQTFVINLAVQKSVFTQPLKARVLDFSTHFLAAGRGGLESVTRFPKTLNVKPFSCLKRNHLRRSIYKGGSVTKVTLS